MNTEKRKEQWRRFAQKKTALMTPEQLESSRTEKAAYDAAYRVKNAAKRAAQKTAYWANLTPQKKAAIALVEKLKRHAIKPPIPKLTPEEKQQRYIESQKRYADKHPDRCKKSYAENLEARLAQKKEYYEQNKPEVIARNNKYTSARRKVDGGFRAGLNCYTRISALLRGTTKSAKTMALIGCTREELMTHLEKQFTTGMTWGNYGRKGWHIDHIHPCSKFDLTNSDDQKKCFHYTNLQPLWMIDNLRKSNK